MKKRLFCFSLTLCLLLASCAPAAQEPQEPEETVQTWEVTVDVSQIDALPDDIEGSFLCTLTYAPGEELLASVQNNTEFVLTSGSGDGLLYRQGAGNGWTRMNTPLPVAPELVVTRTEPGTANETAFYAAGFSEPELNAGEYKLVFSVWLEGDSTEDIWDFNLEIPFSVA